MKRLMLAILFVNSLINPGLAENRVYGTIDLTGLARVVDWPLNPVGIANAMVCNVNGPDGFLSIRSGPGANFKINRKLNRLAIVEVDTANRLGNWVKVNTAFRTVSKTGKPITHKSLHVSGWAHDGFLCAYID